MEIIEKTTAKAGEKGETTGQFHNSTYQNDFGFLEGFLTALLVSLAMWVLIMVFTWMVF